MYVITLMPLFLTTSGASWLGFSPETDLQRSCVTVVAVVPSTPAARVLRPGDCISRLGSIQVNSSEQLMAALSKIAVGGSVVVGLADGGTRLMMAEARPDDAAIRVCKAVQALRCRVRVFSARSLTESKEYDLRPGSTVADARMRSAATGGWVVAIGNRECNNDSFSKIDGIREDAELKDGVSLYFYPRRPPEMRPTIEFMDAGTSKH